MIIGIDLLEPQVLTLSRLLYVATHESLPVRIGRARFFHLQPLELHSRRCAASGVVGHCFDSGSYVSSYDPGPTL